MKKRNGFVSNSSSSSFIVASDKEAGDIEMSLTLSVRLRDLTEETITTVDELIAHYKDCWGYTTEKEILSEKMIASEYKRCLKELKCGKKLHVVSVSSDGTPLEAAIYDSGEGKLPTSPDYEVISK